MEVHITGDVDDRAASGGCCVSTCSALRFLLVSMPVMPIPITNSELGSGTGETCVVNAKSVLGLTLNPDVNSDPPEYGFVLLYQ
jgi:hypothetical protein